MRPVTNRPVRGRALAGAQGVRPNTSGPHGRVGLQSSPVPLGSTNSRRMKCAVRYPATRSAPLSSEPHGRVGLQSSPVPLGSTNSRRMKCAVRYPATRSAPLSSAAPRPTVHNAGRRALRSIQCRHHQPLLTRLPRLLDCEPAARSVVGRALSKVTNTCSARTPQPGPIRVQRSRCHLPSSRLTPWWVASVMYLELNSLSPRPPPARYRGLAGHYALDRTT